MLEHLERLPPTAERDRMLREVRARVVDVDTGVQPSALLPVYSASMPEADPDPPSTRAPRPVAPPPARDDLRLKASIAPRARPVPAAPVDPAAPQPAADGSLTGADDPLALAAGELLSLDDSASVPAAEGQAQPTAAPWTRGLRG
jgi:hypothetical protein